MGEEFDVTAELDGMEFTGEDRAHIFSFDEDEGLGVGYRMNSRTTQVLKALAKTAPESAQIETALDAQRALGLKQAIDPPFPFESLLLVMENSSILKQAVEVYAQNIDGFGHTLQPLLDFSQPDANDKAKAILIRDRERWVREHHNMIEEGDEDREPAPFGIEPPEGVKLTSKSEWVKKPSDEEVAAAIEIIEIEMAEEKEELEAFLCFCSADQSFVDLRKDTRRDETLLANAAWELLRDEDGELAGIERLPFHSVWLLPADAEKTSFMDTVRLGPGHFKDIPRKKAFRRYVQLTQTGKAVYFKEFRDPRVINRETGEVMEIAEGETPDPKLVANELYHFKPFGHDRSVYGIPFWIGGLLPILGNRQAEELNLNHFNANGFPRGMLAVEGGRTTAGTIQRITQFTQQQIKGQKSFEKILVLEAVAGNDKPIAPGMGTPRVRWIDLSGAMQSDGLYLKYQAFNVETVQSVFRLPPFFFGRVKDHNRASAETAKRTTEEQVFLPARESFDNFMNRFILPALGSKWWEFKSKGIPMSDPEMIAKVVKTFVEAEVITPGEGRQLASSALGVSLSTVEEFMAKIPPKMKQAIAAQMTVEELLRAFGVELPVAKQNVEFGPDDAGKLQPAQRPEEEIEDLEDATFAANVDPDSLTVQEKTDELSVMLESLNTISARADAIAQSAAT